MLLHAKRPALLQVALVWQGDTEPFSTGELEDLAQLWGEIVPEVIAKPNGRLPLPGRRSIERNTLLNGRIRLLHLKADEARGPCWARYLAQLLWEGEELYLQLDSHMRFVPHWDTHMRDQLSRCL